MVHAVAGWHVEEIAERAEETAEAPGTADIVAGAGIGLVRTAHQGAAVVVVAVGPVQWSVSWLALALRPRPLPRSSFSAPLMLLQLAVAKAKLVQQVQFLSWYPKGRHQPAGRGHSRGPCISRSRFLLVECTFGKCAKLSRQLLVWTQAAGE